jgi:hypothetical protein
VQLPLGDQVETRPFVELSYGKVAKIDGGLFDPGLFYGKSSFWSLSVGARLTVGMPMHRMGRYGVAQDTATGTDHRHHEHYEHSD